MQYRTLGRTGVQVSSLVLGAMNFGAIGRTTQDEATALVEGALAGGINLIDTADMYSGGESEERVGKAIAAVRHSALPPRPVTATPLTAHSYGGQTTGAPLAARVLNPEGEPGVGAAATVGTGLP